MEQSLLKIETDPEYGGEPGGGERGGGDPARLPILKPGKNCWRIEHADRAAFLVDGAEYFRAFREVLLKFLYSSAQRRKSGCAKVAKRKQ